MKKYDVATLQAFAAAKGGLLLSTEYVDSKHKLLWQCKDGHQWEAHWNSINSGSWCPYCAGKAKPNIIELQEYASSKQGKLISTKYINNNTKLLWECSEGHQWEACWNNIKNAGQWCPACSSTLCDIKELQKHAENKNGRLLSIKYINNNTKLLWECSEGHQWEARWDHIKNSKSWCPECCAELRKCSIIELQQFASSKQGKLISTKYTNAKQALDWECKEKHHWKASWDNITHGTWCPACSSTLCDIKELQKHAENKNGKLISTKYINANSKLLWECSEGHQWEARWTDIKNAGHWCPECASFKTEYKCKELLEQKFRFGFKKTRFYYDKNNKHKFFEFDGYNAENKVAFEYQGIQHYVYPNFFHKTLEIHENAKQRDLDKINYVKENNIKLIIIPYTEEKNLEEYINKQIENITI